MVAYIERKNGLNLWQIGHYHYEITESTQPYAVVVDLPGTTFEKAREIFDDVTKNR